MNLGRGKILKFSFMAQELSCLKDSKRPRVGVRMQLDQSSIFSSPGRSLGRAIVLPPRWRWRQQNVKVFTLKFFM